MSSSEQHTIAASMSEDKGQYTRQLRNVAAVYNGYRIVLPIVLLLTYVSTNGSPSLGAINPELFLQATGGYVLLGLILAILGSLEAQPGSGKTLSYGSIFS